MEIWKPVLDYPTYQVSSLGRFRNYKGQILGQKYNKDGYLRLQFCVNYKISLKMAHRVIAEAFLGIPVDSDWKKIQVNHINSVKDDNRIENLEWVTAKENTSKARIKNPKMGNWKKDR
jgi:hypothetical protein